MKRSQIQKYDDELLWNVLESYMTQYKFLVKHHHDSYNYFIKHDIKNILTNSEHVFYLRQYGNKIYRNIIEFEDIRLTDPVHTMNKQDIITTPQTARDRNISYESKLYVTAIQKQHIVDLYNKTEETKEILRKEIVLANIPVMIYSDLCILNKEEYKRKDCKYENGGYFIVNGGEKLCISQERLVYNRIFVYKRRVSEFDEFQAEVTSDKSKYTSFMSTLRISMKKKNIITVSLPIFKNTINIPVILLIYLCGIESDAEILNLIMQDANKKLLSEYIVPFFQYKSLLDKSLNPLKEKSSINVDSIYEDLKNYIVKDIFGSQQDIENIHKIYIQNELKTNLLPHLGTDLIKKGKYICYMINKLLLTKIGQLELTDRDNYTNKRLETTGTIIKYQFKHSIEKVFSECELIFRKRLGNNLDALLNPPSAIEFLKLSTFDKEFKTAFTTGAVAPLNRKGVFHVYKQISYMDSLAHTRTIVTPITGASGKIIPPRYVHSSQFGYICPVESPEGKNIGLTKFLANSCNITGEDIEGHDKLLLKLSDLVISINSVEHYDMYKYSRVFVDGDWIGFTKNPFELKEKIILMRRNGSINKYFSVNLDFSTKEIHIQTDSGRFIRPLLIVEDNRIKLPGSFIEKNKSWDHYDKSGTIEYLDIEESQTCMIALNHSYIEKNKMLLQNKKKQPNNEFVFKDYNNNIKRYTHCEIHSLAVLGLISACLPFQNHNQAPKDTSTCKYIKQAIGVFNPAFRERFDKQALILHYPQKPLVTTKIHKVIKIDELPTGQNAIVALACYSGYNQEDSVIINKSSVDRGFFNLSYFKSYEDKLKQNITTGKNDIFFKPNSQKVSNVKKANYEKIQDNGFINEETPVGPYDAIIGKLTPVGDEMINDDKMYRDTSTVLKITESGTVDKVITDTYDAENNEICKVRIRSNRYPNIGDKFCYDDQTEILTNTGWKLFSSLDYTNKIATLEKNELKYIKPLEIVNFDYEGEMIKLESRQCNYCVTPNHKLYVKQKNKFKLLEASELYHKSKIFRTKSYYKGLETTRTNTRLYLHGILISLGFFRNNKVYISEKYEQVVDLCKKLNIKYKLSNSFIIINYIHIDNLFPSWLWKISTKKIVYLINGIFNNTKENNIFVSKNTKIIDDIQRLIIHAGYQSKLTMNKNNYSIQLIKDNVYYRENSDVEKKIQYNGKVYCCTSKSGVICVRRKGITMWNGNSSRMGQKGTVGILLRQEDMPFTKTGLVPDIIMNPHAIPTRMSMGQIIECVLGKIGGLEGHDIDGSSFNNIDIDNFPKILKKYGFSESGEEEMRCGLTGRKLTSKIFIGPTYYQRLKHMAEDKIHARGGSGPTSLLTREPPKGRAQDGGLRIGEMERDSFIAHGLSLFLKEKLVDSSDAYYCYVCDKCGILAHKKLDMDYYICPLCDNTKQISRINIPYNFKLFMQEMMSVGVKTELVLDKNRFNYGL